MGVCDNLLKQDIVPSCDDPAIPGFEQEGVLINRKDIDFANVTFNVTRSNVMEALPLKQGKKGFKIVALGAQPFNGTGTAFAAGTYRNSFNNTFAFVVLDDGPDVRGNSSMRWRTGSLLQCLRTSTRGMVRPTRETAHFRCTASIRGLRLPKWQTASIQRTLTEVGQLRCRRLRHRSRGLYLF